jgi:hypothetical protein
LRSKPPIHRAKQGQKYRFLLATLALAETGCSRGTAPIAHPGDSTESVPVTQSDARPKQTSAEARWERFDEIRRWPSVHEKPFASLGHLSARYSASVIVDPTAREAYLNLVTASSLPVGSVVAELHQDPRTGNQGPVFAMQKLAEGRWEYLVVDPVGKVQQRGQLTLCQRCHAEGVADQLFGLPGSARPSKPD